MPPNTGDWTNFYSLLKRKCGLDLNLYKANQMQRRIWSMATNRGAKDLKEFWEMLSADPNGIEWFLDKMAINVSELFRNPERFADLEHKVLPMLLKNKSSLKIWSAGCSYGAEAFSVASILAANVPGRHTILGTDIDKGALAQAKKGVFSAADIKGVPAAYRKWFEKTDAGWAAKQELHSYCRFAPLNLLADRFDRDFDLILCRNVVIYFTDEAKDELNRKFFGSLLPGGVLFVGGSERINHSEKLGFSQFLPFFYQKPIDGQQIWRNVS